MLIWCILIYIFIHVPFWIEQNLLQQNTHLSLNSYLYMLCKNDECLEILNYVFFANIDFGVHIERDKPKHKTNY